MNEEIIKKLIQLTQEQQALLELAENAIAALCRSGVNLFFDYENEEIRAINVNAFACTEAADYSDEEYYHDNGYETIPYWKGKLVSNYTCSMNCNDYLYGQIKPELLNQDRNLFNK